MYGRGSAKDTGTLQYEVFFNDDSSECIVYERHRDSDALLEHSSNLGSLMRALFRVCTGSGTRRDRDVLYLKPLEQYFRVSLALGPRAVEAARGQKLPARVLRLIDEAVQYPEGKAVRLEIRDPKDIAIAMQLAAIKLGA